MKALSVRQPFALDINDGLKDLEFRPWKTSYRGPLLICASNYDSNLWLDIDAADLDGNEVKLTRPLPRGCMLCVVNLVDIRRMTEEDAEEYETHYYPDMWAWVLEHQYDVEPDPVKGKLGLFEVDDKLIAPLKEGEEWWMYDYPNYQDKPPKNPVKLNDEYQDQYEDQDEDED